MNVHIFKSIISIPIYYIYISIFGSQGRRYRRSGDTHARRTRHRSSNIKPSGHERSHGIDGVDPSSGDSHWEIRNPPRTLGRPKVLPSPNNGISLPNINEELCSASYVGRKDGYKGPSLRDLSTVHGDFSTLLHLRDGLGTNDEHRYYITYYIYNIIYIYIYIYIYLSYPCQKRSLVLGTNTL